MFWLSCPISQRVFSIYRGTEEPMNLLSQSSLSYELSLPVVSSQDVQKALARSVNEIHRFLANHGIDIVAVSNSRPFVWEPYWGQGQYTEQDFMITPQLAAEILCLSAGNPRGVLNSSGLQTVSLYSQVMKKGLWAPNHHQGIAFNELGQFTDGHKRMMAIVDSGCTIPFLATFNVPHFIDRMATDRGDPRKETAILRSLGVAGLTSSRLATARRMMQGDIARVDKVDIFTLHRFYSENSEPIDFSHRAIAERMPGISNAGVRGAFAKASRHIDLEALVESAKCLTKGISKRDNDPMVKLQKTLIGHGGGKYANLLKSNSSFDWLRYRLTELAIKAHVAGESIYQWERGNGKWEGECFPLL